MSHTVSITVTQQNNYQFLVDFGAALPQLLADEPAPLGAGAGPSPSHMLLAAVANCLSSSLYFALQKFKQDAGGITTTATAHIDRNEQNHLRVLDIAVDGTTRLATFERSAPPEGSPGWPDLPGHRAGEGRLVPLAEGRRLLTFDGGVRLRDGATGALLATLAEGPRQGLVAVLTDGRIVLVDPDGTRTELMEPKTVDGLPVPSSTAPPPR